MSTPARGPLPGGAAAGRAAAGPGEGPASAQAHYRPLVLGNQLSIAGDWGQPCLSYLLCIRPGAAAQAGLAAAQDAVAGPERSLLRIPPAALHISVSWLLPVHQEFSRPKQELWAEYGPGWLAALIRELRPLPAFRLRLRHLVATDSAIIAVAEAPNPVASLRERLAGLLALPGRPLSRGDFVHTTIFRYGGPLADPAGLLDRVARARADVEVPVHEMLLVREEVFPSLGYQAVHNFTLVPAEPATPPMPPTQ